MLISEYNAVNLENKQSGICLYYWFYLIIVRNYIWIHETNEHEMVVYICVTTALLQISHISCVIMNKIKD